MMWDRARLAKLRRRQLKWFDTHQRDLPWRHNKTPYRIWISEIMLQQTQVATVISYFKRFIERFPDVRSLAAAETEEVLRLWEGLGYYRRARQMHAAAKLVVEQHDGEFPQDFDDVLALPGIGRYTAGAILSIATDQRHPILEANTIRLFARLMKMEADPKTSVSQKALWEFAELILPRKRVGDFNQSLMELGSEICTPRKPLCDRCPIADLCPTFAEGLQDSIPMPGKKKVYEDLHEAAVLIQRTSNGHTKYFVRVCGEDERWTGLWDFPRYTVDVNDSLSQQIAAVESMLREKTGIKSQVRPLGKVIRHAVTRYRIRLQCFAGQWQSGARRDGERAGWRTAEELQAMPMSVSARKIVQTRIRMLESGDGSHQTPLF